MTIPPRPIYIRSAAQISAQSALTDEWLTAPAPLDGPYVRAVDPAFRQYLPPLEARRMSRVLKRAAVVSDCALAEAGLERTDAIVTGTGLGCVESTEHFLDALCRTGETLLSPAHFMQSTHNTISSLIAIRTRCHGYNVTFSHKTISFDLALHDARLLLAAGEARTVLVGGYDEVTPAYFTLLRRQGYVGREGQVACTEAAAAFVLSADAAGARCRVDDVAVHHVADVGAAAARVATFLQRNGLTPADVDGVMTGLSGDPANDAPYAALCRAALPGVPVLAYKSLFGENYSASALGFYAACCLLQADRVPTSCLVAGGGVPVGPLRRLLVVNHSQGADFSLALLSRLAPTPQS